ncbi:lytic polysaccharide monooxygenase [Streptomyces sp. TRM 70361]|uniref:lytic polysaccharide monooxygenase auxiliary activity family 9 protein n=1 Tax=Streptomyces sp. TRM 70361 TaxID=3116553 RepID=UPI002E7BB3E1|nr:lytic polysaccharide monooxygenase [Streptomyces sp. TRM 70361]MEE1942736.1 lytic polysaccharide monooxygenase [Streptomyces sp. TRM 70361]
MTVSRRAAALVAAGTAPFALCLPTAAPAAAHGSLTDPVSRVAACHAEGPEAPKSAACKALVAAGGTQPLYDWNEVNIADAAGRHRQIIPDGKLCSAGRDKYKGLDLPRSDWPATPLTAGDHTFRYRATAPHKGTFELYLTKAGYDPAKPLAWSDLEAEPFAKVTDPRLEDGSYVFSGTVPERSGRHLVYSVWQRSDSPEAFYTCSDVVFGGNGGGGAGTAPAAPTDEQIEESAEKSTVSHDGHGGDEHGEKRQTAPLSTDGTGTGGGKPAEPAAGKAGTGGTGTGKSEGSGKAPNGTAVSPAEDTGDGGQQVHLAETGGDDSTTAVALGGAAAVMLGGAVLLATARRRSARSRHRA